MSDDSGDTFDERLAELLIPADVVAASEQLFTWRTIDAELAALEDEDVADAMSAGVRSTALTATVSFGNDSLRIEIEYNSETRSISGQIFPPLPATAVLLRPTAEPLSVSVAATGTFQISDVPPGPLQLRVDAEDRTAKTDWIVLNSSN